MENIELIALCCLMSAINFLGVKPSVIFGTIWAVVAVAYLVKGWFF